LEDPQVGFVQDVLRLRALPEDALEIREESRSVAAIQLRQRQGIAPAAAYHQEVVARLVHAETLAALIASGPLPGNPGPVLSSSEPPP